MSVKTLNKKQLVKKILKTTKSHSESILASSGSWRQSSHL